MSETNGQLVATRDPAIVAPLATELAKGLGGGVAVRIDSRLAHHNPEGKKPVAKKPAAEKPATVKKPRAPRKPKAAKPVETTPIVEPPKVIEPEATAAVVETPKTVEATKPASSTVDKPVVAAKKPAAKRDPFASLFKAGAALEAVDIVGSVAMKDDILANPKAVAMFVKAISDADRLAISRLSFDRPESEVCQEWYALNFARIEAQLQVWKKTGNDSASKILAVFAEVRQLSKVAIEPLWQLYREIVRPANNANSYPELTALLKVLRKKNLTQVDFCRRNYPEARAIRINVGDRDWNIHMPAQERGRTIPIIDVAWPFLKAAESRAKQRARGKQDLLRGLRKSADEGYFPADAEAGEDGTLFLGFGESRGASIQVRNTDAGIRVRVSNAIGFPFHTPTQWLSWNAKQSAWPDNGLFKRFEAWKGQPPLADYSSQDAPAAKD